ncbi:hypothetical protein PN36_34490 [Candidatus Thiomargarita nelsonii]|uniref:Uncharacterized protein n=1 Tax=Candidatus Thiomargarita nelsonii TaxID=1003181 RepID=A0A0A6RZ76_9GAMM|nr:hypothetical protein PN36_34490 [Candidatus Thiomargarita nelsonii]
MEFNKRELRTIISALKLQIVVYTKIETKNDIDEEDLAEVIMDRGYTESLLSAVEYDYKQLNSQLLFQRTQQQGAMPALAHCRNG